MLSIVVCMRITVDTAQLRADVDTGAPKLDGVPLRLSTFDEHALEEAVRLKARHGGRIRTLSLVSEPPPKELILKALAMGADEACVIEDASASDADALATATILARGLRELGEWDLLLCGEGSIDRYDRQVGPRLAEALGIPVLTHATAIEIVDGEAIASLAVDDCVERVATTLPALLTVGSEINDPRLPTVLQIMAASRKKIVQWDLQRIGLDADAGSAGLSAVEVLEVVAPTTARKRIAIEGENAEEIARKLMRVLYEEGAVKGQ